MRMPRLLDPAFWTGLILGPPASRVLLVEDDLHVRTILLRILESIDPGIQVDVAEGYEEAAELLGRHRHTLVVADYFLKGRETGMELWRDCKSRRPAVPFLLMSGLSKESVARLSSSGAGGGPEYLIKPFYAQQAGQVLAGLLGKKPAK